MRRYLVRPKGLQIRKEYALMHGLLFAMGLAGLGEESLRILHSTHWWGGILPW